VVANDLRAAGLWFLSVHNVANDSLYTMASMPLALLLTLIQSASAAAHLRKQPQHSALKMPLTAHSGSNTTNFAAVLATMANDCQCSFRGVCTCELELEFMNCIRDACASGKCACDGHFMEACGQMSATCPQNNLQCSENKEVTCTSAAALNSSETTVAPAAKGVPEGATAIPDDVPLSKMWKESLQSWMTTWQQKASERFWGTIVYIILGIVCAYLYYKREIAGSQEAFGDKHITPGFAFKRIAVMKDSEWNSNLFDCMYAPRLFCFSCCCPCLIWADTADKSRVFKILNYWRGFAIFFALMVLSSVTGGATGILITIMGVAFRQSMRLKYRIRSGGMTLLYDCCAWCCCTPCAIMQERSEEHFQAVHNFATR